MPALVRPIPRATALDDGESMSLAVLRVIGDIVNRIVYGPTPADGLYGVLLAPLLSWPASGHTTTYTIYLSTTNPPTTSVSVAQAGLTYQVTANLAYGTTYYWRVRSNNAYSGGSGAIYSDTWSFTTIEETDGEVINEDSHWTVAANGQFIDWLAEWTIHPTMTGTFTTHDATDPGLGVSNGRISNLDATLAMYFEPPFNAPGSADYEVLGTIWAAAAAVAGSHIGIVGRMHATNHEGYYAYYDYDTITWNLAKIIAGVVTVLDTSTPQGLVFDQGYRVRLSMVGTTIQMFVDGVIVNSVTDASIAAAGKVGVRGLNAGLELSLFRAMQASGYGLNPGRVGTPDATSASHDADLSATSGVITSVFAASLRVDGAAAIAEELPA